MQLFYHPDITEDLAQCSFDRIESRHIIKVLRKKEGDHLIITDGNGRLFDGKIVMANDKKCLVNIISSKKIPHPRNYYVHLAIAPTKNNDRMEWFLEKATEIGIDEITPVICEHSERRVLKSERFQKIIEAAMKQSLQYYLPVLNKPVRFPDLIQRDLGGKVFIAHCQGGEKKGLKSVAKPGQKATILIGPEGDFSANEISASIQKGCIPVSLGENRLRTETAAIVAVQNMAFINQ